MTGRWLLPRALCAHPARGMAEGRTLCIHQHRSLPPLLTLPSVQYHTPGPLPHPFRLHVSSTLQHDYSHHPCPWGGGDTHLPGPPMFLCRIWSHSRLVSHCRVNKGSSQISIPPFPSQHGALGRDSLPSMQCTQAVLPGTPSCPRSRERLSHVLEAGPAAQCHAHGLWSEVQRGILVKPGRELLAGGHTACLLPKGRESTAGRAKLMSRNKTNMDPHPAPERQVGHPQPASV